MMLADRRLGPVVNPAEHIISFREWLESYIGKDQDQSNPWNKSQQTSYFSIMIATASTWSMAVRPVPPLFRSRNGYIMVTSGIGDQEKL